MTARSRLLVNLLLTGLVVGGLYLILKDRDLSAAALVEACRRFHPLTVAGVVALAAMQVGFMILRMIVLAPTGSRGQWGNVAFAVGVGHAVNMFLPARAGEALKAVWLGRAGGQDTGYIARGAGWIVADRTADLLAFLILIAATGVFRLPEFQERIPLTRWQLLGGAAAVPVGLVVLNRYSQGMRSRFQIWVGRLRDGLSALQHPMKLPLGVGAALGGWVVELLALHLLCRAQGYTLSVAQLYFVLVVLNVAVAVPIAVANVGTFEAAIAFALGTFGVPTTEALAVGAAHHLLQLAGVAAVGLAALLGRRMAARLCRLNGFVARMAWMSRYRPGGVPRRESAYWEGSRGSRSAEPSGVVSRMDEGEDEETGSSRPPR